MTILEKIDKLRKERGWTVNYLAMEAGLTQSTLNNLYSRNAEPKISTLRAICGAFGMTLAEFFAEDDENEDGQWLNGQLGYKISQLSESQKKALLTFLSSVKTD